MQTNPETYSNEPDCKFTLITNLVFCSHYYDYFAKHTHVTLIYAFQIVLIYRIINRIIFLYKYGLYCI
jgi:hypothetical protein